MTAQSDWFDCPNPNPKRRRPMEELVAELAAKHGDPDWPVERLTVSETNGHWYGGGRAKKFEADALARHAEAMYRQATS